MERYPLYVAVLNNDLKTVAAGDEKAILELAIVTQTGMTTDEFAKIVADWIATAKRRPFAREFLTDLALQQRGLPANR